MEKTNKQHFDNSNKFICIKYLLTESNGDFKCKRRNNKIIFEQIETYINTDFIVEITSLITDNYSVKCNKDYYSTYHKETMFRIYLSDGRNFYLLQNQYEKFKDLINNE